MSFQRRCWNKRTLTLFLTLNLIVLGCILLIQFDSDSFLDWRRKNPDQSAYDRWRQIRDDWDSYSKSLAARQVKLQQKIQGKQMDAVVGFDYFKNAKDSSQNDDYKTRNGTSTVKKTSAEPLDAIPPVPKFSDSDYVPSLNANITKLYLELPKLKYSYKIVILTPVCDVAGVLGRFVKQLSNLNYPHHLLSVYFGEDSSSDRTLDMATLIADDLTTKYGFHAAAAFHFNISGGVHGSWGDVHDRTSQHNRRAHLAKSRNMLLEIGLKKGDFDYVLWIDSDISELPSDLIQQLLFARSDVVAPSCLYKSGIRKRNFDKNSWRETPTSIEDQQHLPRDVIIVEGYSNTHRIFLPDLRAEGRVVPLDGVGGCTLLIRTECHTKGLKFPTEVYSHHIETEGLAKMAKHMGFSVVGMPFVEVIH